MPLFIAALWSPADKGLISWLSFVMFNCVFVTFQCGIQGQVWYLIASIPDLGHISNFKIYTPLDLNVSSIRKLKLLSDCLDAHSDLKLPCTLCIKLDTSSIKF